MPSNKAASGSHIRDASPDDAAAVLRINHQSEEWTSRLEQGRLQTLAERAALYRVAEIQGEVVGFVLAMREDSGYRNDNLEWFRRRYETFLYVDRIVVHQSFAGRQIGTALYDDVFAIAADLGIDRVVCEYTWRPRNIASEKFHRRMGFREVGHRSILASDKIVSMQCRFATYDATRDG